MKTNSIISADIFVIPNKSLSVLREKPTSNFEFWGDLEAVHTALRYGDKLISSDFESEEFVQIWFCTPESEDSNWYDHLIDGHPELENWQPRCQYLPKSLFEGHKEGDVITFTLPVERMHHRSRKYDPDMKDRIEYDRIKVSMTLAQLKYRYRRFGPFEEVLKRV